MDVAGTVQSCGRSSQGLATARQLRAAGLAPAALARAVAAREVIRIHRRVYALAPLPAWTQHIVTDKGVASTWVQHVRAALLSLGPGALAHRRTAAALRGWGLLVEPSRSIEVAVPHSSRRAAVHEVKLTERRGLALETVASVKGTEGIAVTTAIQTVIDCGVSLPLVEAVVVCDSALRSGDVNFAELQLAAGCLRGVKEARRCRRVLELADPACGSVLESVLRVRMVLAGLVGFGTQCVITDTRTGRVLRVDFAFEDARLVVEADGSKWHQDPVRDRERDNLLAVLGWRVLRFTWAEVVHSPVAVLRQISAAADIRISDGQLLHAATAVAA